MAGGDIVQEYMQSLKGKAVLSGGASVAGAALGAIISKVWYFCVHYVLITCVLRPPTACPSPTSFKNFLALDCCCLVELHSRELR